ncbi:MAG: 50S ribosomal protein L35 [Elusimicrobia bacterium RIFCSPLOWO2_02_FULL_39_32]|nr:MAG: 50S ribosomal protein L35 [Elusimicrobia bacterium GWA2_38_7]OGR79555.1 MAG: 50S ribosomal protein L35 [Elusimicrobia bacterium RIFCSPHIGHO2_02_FULL_39_36]OGR92881.1 MAG: 50S ribosomal protein L35 [Elusimicrobia bacterium RIFCSPLOWO2_02_FULL_39_32]OGR99665.1 MAG: 50S ribosomal protein L35 [Elusimicrobia bacterium RIFCSPLOWO2_12_FULL_39_28]
MPKLKNHSGAKKRFRFTANLKVKYKKAGARHLLAGMSSKRGRFLRKAGYLQKQETSLIKKMLPYH